MDTYRERKREKRIRHRNRMIARGRRYFLERHVTTWTDSKFSRHEAEIHGRYFHNHLCICSCDVCGNPRHSNIFKTKEKITLQERRAKIDEYEQLKEYGLI